MKKSETVPASKDKYLNQKYLQPLELETTSASKVPAIEEEKDNHSKKKKKDKRWSLQDEIAKLFETSLKGAFHRWEEGVPCSISPYPNEDCDYLCTSVLHVWPEIRSTRMYRGPTDAGVGVRRNIMVFDYSDMIERCVVCGPGFVKFKLSRKWIAKGIHKMLKDGLDTWAPKLSVKKAIIYFLSQNIAQEMHTGHLRSTVIGETLARILEYSRVEVIRRFDEGDELDVKGKSLHDSYISKTLDLLREKGFTIDSEGDDAISIEGWKLPLKDLAALWHALDMEKADRIVHVSDVGQRDYIEICISAAKHAGWIVNDHCPCLLSHVGFGLVKGDDFEISLLDEAKSRCKVVLAGQGKAYEWTGDELEHTAEALAYAAVKYENLKNNRLTNFTIDFDQMLNGKGNTVLYLRCTHAQVCSVINKHRSDIKKLKKLKVEMVEELVLKNDEERLLGLHLLRFTEVLGEVCTALMPHILCEYLFDLCNKFNSFHPCVCYVDVVEYGDEKSKLLLCEATAMVMKKCFHLLGITPICKKYTRKEKEPETTTSAAKVPNKEEKMASFGKGPGILFELCNVVLRHNIDARVENGGSYNELRLFGTLQAETHISDPSHYGSFDIFNRNFDDPLVITKLGSLSPHDIQYCSLTASTLVKIIAKLYGTTYKGDDEMESNSDYNKYYLETGIPPSKLYGGISRNVYPDKVRQRFAEYKKGLFPPLEEEKENKKVYIDDDLFEVCDDYAFINFSEFFSNRPNGGSGSFKLKGKDGYLEVYYVALKNAAEAALEVDFVAPSKETKVVGRVMAYYGNNFCYGCTADEKDLYNAMLFETEQPEVKHGKINLMRSVLAVPSQFSLIIDANFSDFTSGDIILSGVCEFPVPAVNGSGISVGSIKGNDCALNLKVDWNLPHLWNDNTRDSGMDRQD